MRNLKRALSLSMACIMLLGLLVVGASAAFADFTDVDKIENVEAVSTLVELGVIAGKEDGSYFDPNGIITRYEMCKLICVALSGGREPSLGIKDTPTYSDIKGSWAEAYVEYCSALGIVAGDGSGKFNGNLTVTGSEAAKMLLCALGYKADVEGYVGASWEINTNVRADQLDLYKGLEGLNPALGLIRDDAAQMVFNALSCEEMYYTGAVVVGGVTIGNSQLVSRGYTWLEKRFGVEKFEGVIIANENASFTGDLLNKGNTRLLVGEYDLTDPTTWEIVTLKTSTSADLVGMKVTVYAKELKGDVYQKVYGAPIVSESNTVVTITKEYTSGATLKSDLSKQGIKSFSGFYMINYANGGVFPWSADPANFDGYTGNGIEITIINNDDSDSAADFIRVKSLTPGKVVAYNAKGNSGDGFVSVNMLDGNLGFSGEKFEDVIGYEDIAKDDIVLYYELEGKFYVQLADSDTVTVDKRSTNGSITAGASTYKATGLVSDAADEMAALSLGKDAELFFDEYGYVIHAKGVDEVTNYLFTTSVQKFDDGTINDIWADSLIKAVLQDGTSVTAKVYSVDGDKPKVDGGVSENNADPETIYEYSVRADGSYVLTSLGSTAKAVNNPISGIGTVEIKKNAPSVVGETANSKTVFLLKVGSSWYSYTGIANVPSTANEHASGDLLAYYADGGFLEIVVLTGAKSTGVTGKNIVLLSETVVTSGTDADKKYSVLVLVDGVTQEIEIDGATSVPTLGDANLGLYLDVTLTAAGKLPLAVLTGGPDQLKSRVEIFSNNIIKNGDETLSYNNNTKVLVIDGIDVEESEIGAVVRVDDMPPYDNNSNVILVPDKDDENVAAWVLIIVE